MARARVCGKTTEDARTRKIGGQSSKSFSTSAKVNVNIGNIAAPLINNWDKRRHKIERDYGKS